MQPNLSNVEFVIGNQKIVEGMTSLKAFHPFDNEILDFFNDLSKCILKEGKAYSDVMTFGFWCRKASLAKEKEKYDDVTNRLGRGIIFHSTPSNVPVNFAFSFAAGLLAGNANIVRLPGKPFEQVQIICRCVEDALKLHPVLKEYICFIKYPPDDELHTYFSSICDSRVVWGGDNTINELRHAPLKSRATEVNFADRYSIALINSNKVLEEADNLGRLAQDFYNDTFFSDQNACTSPRIIFWLGNNIPQAKEKFWGAVLDLEKKKYSLAESQSTGKLNAMYKVASKIDLKLNKFGEQYLYCLEVDGYEPELMDYRYNSGFFYEVSLNSIEEIIPYCQNRCQTLGYFGFDKTFFNEFLNKYSIKGVDRIVPIGKTMDFALIWDGYDLIRVLSRYISVI